MLVIEGQAGRCEILPGAGLDFLSERVGKRQALIVTDQQVRHIWGSSFPRWPVLEIAGGETCKTLATVEMVCRQIRDLGADRHSMLIGIGGGVVGDVTGLAAAIFMRGIACGLVPTTLLAQVDAAVGGKNGVNLDGYKNLIGTFRQPEFVLCDQRLLRTLPETEIKSGLAEIIKAAAIADADLFSFLEGHIEKIAVLNEEFLAEAVRRALAIKVNIVQSDELEQGERRKLNFGHTVGHALEKVLLLTHGEAVALGMIVAAGYAVRSGLLAAGEVQRLQQLLQRGGLPYAVPKLASSAIAEIMQRDKKKKGELIRLVLLRRIGEAVIIESPLAVLKEMVS